MKSVTAETTYVEIQLEEIDKYLKRAFRVLRPRAKVGFKGEIVYDLFLSENVIIRIFTSIFRGREKVRSVGKDSIKIGLLSASGKPFEAGTLPHINRTIGWRDSLRKKIEAAMEDYDDREGYLEYRATGVPAPHGP